jgi:benzodiazapine receptor
MWLTGMKSLRMSRMTQTYGYYEKLDKPSFAPPQWLFGVVWSILYPIILASFGFTLWKVYQGLYPATLVAPILINLASNAAFTFFQFKLRNNFLALIDILICVSSLAWAMVLIYDYQHLVFWLLAPYALWVSFATLLQFAITIRNRKRA